MLNEYATLWKDAHWEAQIIHLYGGKGTKVGVSMVVNFVYQLG